MGASASYADRKSSIVRLLLLLCWMSTRQAANAQARFANVTLEANGGDLSAVIYLPQGIKPDERAYYASSRFDHGSMIGNIARSITRALQTMS